MSNEQANDYVFKFFFICTNMYLYIAVGEVYWLRDPFLRPEFEIPANHTETDYIIIVKVSGS